MARFWVSWYQPGEDGRPLTFPPDGRVLGWWCSGYYSGGSTVCALVSALTIPRAKEAIVASWPEAATAEWRFTERVEDDWLPSDRFPFAAWMKQRIDALVV